MNKIDAMKEHIAALEQGIADYQAVLEIKRKELAALKAESDKPREFVIGIDKSGNAVSLANYGSDLHFYFHGNAPRGYGGDCITVIEKNPIVVTRELTNKMLSAFDAKAGSMGIEARFAELLKAAGIEARAGDE